MSTHLVRKDLHSIDTVRRMGSWALGIMVCLAAVNSAGAGETFTASKLLEYPAESQKGYISNSVMMAAMIVGQNSTEQGKCLDRWIVEHQPKGFQVALDTMKRLPSYHPSAVIVAVLEEACGSFKYVK